MTMSGPKAPLKVCFTTLFCSMLLSQVLAHSLRGSIAGLNAMQLQLDH
jgi:hypothetical protein